MSHIGVLHDENEATKHRYVSSPVLWDVRLFFGIPLLDQAIRFLYNVTELDIYMALSLWQLTHRRHTTTDHTITHTLGQRASRVDIQLYNLYRNHKAQ